MGELDDRAIVLEALFELFPDAFKEILQPLSWFEPLVWIFTARQSGLNEDGLMMAKRAKG